ncbi:MAG TPA: phosphoribosylformylglycinamidine cyclo-ligase [Bacteroidetes bacterium]|nr:phosphoribosylformylglycinamidine cyclo-ligase [Bacteroidota bacterium]
MTATYVQSGVSIAEGDRLVRHIKSAVRSTYSKSVLGDVGLFGAFYDATFRKYKSPVLVSSVDGVGTKLLIAQMMNKHNTIGQDLVNHCVNDILVCGAKPLFFMDYFATGHLQSRIAAEVISGFVKACKENKCSLIGGETAEMPGFYEGYKYDLSGTVVGVVERAKIISGKRIREGDVLLGIPSTGLHTNGYSLAREVLLKANRLDDYFKELKSTLGETLLTVHRSYLEIVNAVMKRLDIHGLAHITGGGIVGNTMRVIPKGLSLSIDWNGWDRPAIFNLIQKIGNVPEKDMRRTFNLGVGLIMIVPSKESAGVANLIRRKGDNCFLVGKVVRGGKNGRR